MDLNKYLHREALAEYLGFPNVKAMEYAITTLPAPDTVYQRKPYWSKETATELLEARGRAIHAAFGGKKEN